MHFPYMFASAFSAYHAGLNNKLRTSVLDDWISSKTQVVVATVAFGYGHMASLILFLSFWGIYKREKLAK